jgi:hypothetical protein
MMYRVFIEETATRLLYRDVEADSKEAANKIGEAAIESDAWTDWCESDTQASLELREELTTTEVN